MGVVRSLQLAHFSSGDFFEVIPALRSQLRAALSREFCISRESPFLVCFHDVFAHHEHSPKR
jgi:hypothetical protein